MSDLNGVNVLFVDDSLVLRDHVSKLLNKYGYDIDTAADGQLGLKMAEACEYSIVLIDLEMPVLGGFELLQKLRTLESYRFTPILMVTANVNKETIIKARKLGATGWISKPFDNNKLLKVLEGLL